MHSSAGRRLFTPLVNAENAEQRLRNKVMKHWKEIQRLCRLHDIDNSGEIESSVFRGLCVEDYILKTYHPKSRSLNAFWN